MKKIAFVFLGIVFFLTVFLINSCSGIVPDVVKIPDLTKPEILNSILRITHSSTPSEHTSSSSPVNLPYNSGKIEITLDYPEPISFTLNFGGKDIVPENGSYTVDTAGYITGKYSLIVAAESKSPKRTSVSRNGSQVQIWFQINNTKAINPIPNDFDQIEIFSGLLEWACIAPEGVDLEYHVFFATSTELLNSQQTPFSTTTATQTSIPGILDNCDYYWRVDSLYGATETVGDIWNFSKYSNYILDVFIEPDLNVGSVTFDPEGEEINFADSDYIYGDFQNNGKRLTVQRYSLKYKSGTNVRIIPAPAEGYGFIDWAGTDTQSITGDFIKMDADREIIARFERQEADGKVKLNTIKDLPYGGEIQADPLPDPDGKYQKNTVVTLKVIPNQNYVFSGFSGLDSGKIINVPGKQDEFKILMDNNRDLIAYFEEKHGQPYLKGNIRHTSDGDAYKSGFEIIIKGYDEHGYEMTCKAITDEHGNWVSESYKFATYSEIRPQKDGCVFLPECRTQKSNTPDSRWDMCFEFASAEGMSLHERIKFAKQGSKIEIPAGEYKEYVYPEVSIFEDVLYGCAVTLEGETDQEGKPLTVINGDFNGNYQNLMELTNGATLSNLKIINSKAEYCTFLYNSNSSLSDGGVAFKNCLFENNKSHDLINANGNASFKDTEFIGNSVDDTLISAAHTAEKNNKLIIGGCVFKENDAKWNLLDVKLGETYTGYYKDNTVEIDGSIFENNCGSIKIASKNVSVNNCRFIGSRAFNYDFMLTQPILQLVSKYSAVADSEISDNYGQAFNLYCFGGGTAGIDNLTVFRNSAHYYDESKKEFYESPGDGTVHAEGGENAVISFKNCLISENIIEANYETHDITNYGWYSFYGGGINIGNRYYNNNSDSTEYLVENCIISKNRAANYIRENPSFPNYTVQGSGGGIYVAAKSAGIVNCTINGNYSGLGGGIAQSRGNEYGEEQDYKEVEVNGGCVNSNISHWSGGAVYNLSDCPVYLDGVEIKSNAVEVWYLYTAEELKTLGICNPIHGKFIEDSGSHIEYPEGYYRLTVLSTPTESGHVRINSGNWAREAREVVYKEENITVDASSSEILCGFEGWAESDDPQSWVSNSSEYTFKIGKDYQLQSRFSLNPDFTSPYSWNYLLVSNESTEENEKPSGTLITSPSHSRKKVPDEELSLFAYSTDMVIPLEGDAGNYTVAVNQKSGDEVVLGATDTFRCYDFEDEIYRIHEFKLKSSGLKTQVWVSLKYDATITNAMADLIKNEFESKIYDVVVEKFSPPSNISGNGKVKILVFDIYDDYLKTGSFTSGYFDSNDLYDKDNSNKSEILYIDTWPSMHSKKTDPVDVSKAYSTIAHEFQHMVNYNRNVLVEKGKAMDTWLDEALSMAAEHMIYGKLKGRIDYYNKSSSIADGHPLFFWDYGNVLPNYSLSYLFMQYLRVQCGKGSDLYKEIMEDPQNDFNCVAKATVKYCGENLLPFTTNWRIAMIMKNPNGKYGFGGEDDFKDLSTPLHTGNGTFLKGSGALVKPKSSLFAKPGDAAGEMYFAGIKK